MAVHDGFYNPQAESEAARLRLFIGAPLKTSKDSVRFSRGGTWAFVLHPTLYPSIGGFGSDPYDAALRCKLVCVGEQVDEHLRQSWLVALDQREVLGQRHFERLPP